MEVLAMKKYLVDVYLPAASKHLDVFLPDSKQIGEVTRLLVNLADSLSNGVYKGTADSMLLSADTGLPYTLTDTVEEAGIRNASRLILI